MKKKIWIPIVVTIVVLLAVLFVPIPQASYDDGGTRVYTAQIYKIVDWNRLTEDGVYEKTRFYFGEDKNKSIDALWELEYENVEQTFIATIIEMGETSVVVLPVAGEKELNSSNQISFNTINLKNIGAMVGSVVEVTYTGGIMESYPAQINAIDWKISGKNSNKKHKFLEASACVFFL